jgi:hypothetical protein
VGGVGGGKAVEKQEEGQKEDEVVGIYQCL